MERVDERLQRQRGEVFAATEVKRECAREAGKRSVTAIL
jgi:hypothetical protein